MVNKVTSDRTERTAEITERTAEIEPSLLRHLRKLQNQWLMQKHGCFPNTMKPAKVDIQLNLDIKRRANRIEIEDITWPLGDTNFIFECWKYLSRVSEANEWEILSAREDKIRIPKRPCNILYFWLIKLWILKRTLWFYSAL